MDEEDEEIRRKRAEELRRALDEPTPGRPRTPREFTDQKAREAAEEARRRAEPDEDREHQDK
jgi:hypothetical protein